MYMYIGTQLDYHLSWHPHVQYACKIFTEKFTELFYVARSLPELSYKQFAIPVLEYCVSEWDPYHQTDIKIIQHT